MKHFIISFVLFFAMGALNAQNGSLTVTSVESTPVTGITVIIFDLTTQTPAKVNETYNISVEVSFDGGDTYTSVPSVDFSGDVENVAPGTGRQITWDGGASFPNTFSEQTKLRLTASSNNAGTFTDTRDGQTYKWARIGEQVWMAENLRYLPEPDPSKISGTSLTLVGPGTGSENDPYAYVYGYDGTDVTAAKATANYQNYGVLYNWPAAMAESVSSSANPSGVQGVCPPGWHVPSHDEWTQLEQYVCNQLGNSDCAAKFPYNDSTIGLRGTNEGNALKSCRQVDSPLGGACNTLDHPRWHSHTHYGTDTFGFSALPGGFRWSDGSFGYVGNDGIWWSATESWSSSAWGRGIRNYFGDVGRYDISKAVGFSLRCVRD